MNLYMWFSRCHLPSFSACMGDPYATDNGRFIWSGIGHGCSTYGLPQRWTDGFGEDEGEHAWVFY